MSDQVKLEDCPVILREEVAKYINDKKQTFSTVETISITVHDSKLYQDSEPVNTYKVYVMVANFFAVFCYMDTPPDMYNAGVHKNLLSIGEIKEIMRSVPEYF